MWKPLEARDAENAHDTERAGRFVARAYSVFNADQVDCWTPPLVPVLSEAERIASAEEFFAAIPAQIDHGGNSACYMPALDRVQMPTFGQFERATSYYATLAHELTHWTGAKSRLDRKLSGQFGSEAYAMEELIAELGQPSSRGNLAYGRSRAPTMRPICELAEGAEGR